MLVFFEERLVLLAVPKTGTTAYETALAPRADIVVSNPPELKHAPLYRYNRFFRPMFDRVCSVEMETVAVMREPLSWIGSWYRYRRRPFMTGKPNSTLDMSFDDFVRAYLDPARPAVADVGRQSKFLEPRPNGTSVTHLFRYEDLAPFDRFLEQRLGARFATSRENVSPALDLTLSPETEHKFRRRCADEFDLYHSID